MDPAEATFLFVGLDASYDAEIERSTVFPRVLEHHQDGVRFWQRHGVHHPFLLPDYTGDGRRYHRNFARIGFSPDHADQVSFVELLHVPTVGRNKLDFADLGGAHLSRLNAAIIEGAAKHVFISSGVVRLMRRSEAFPWLPVDLPVNRVLPGIYRDAHRSVYLHLHFSNYGKFRSRMDAEVRAIAELLRG